MSKPLKGRAAKAERETRKPQQGMLLAGLGQQFAEAVPMTLQRFLHMPEQDRPLFVVSDGMGVDSSGVLEGLRRLGLRPDVILHADTGDEHPATVAFRQIRQEWLRKIGFPEFVMVKRPPGQAVTKRKTAFSTLGEKCLTYETLPSDAFGKKGCSVEWKIEPQESWLAKDPRAQELWARGGRVVKAIGYDAGVKDSARAWKLTNDKHYEYVYPLREWGWDRVRIVAELRAVNAPIPPKSSCYFCPQSKPWEIARLVRDQPHLADKIIEIEDAARPGLRGIEGFWRSTIIGSRPGKGGVRVPTGAIPKPGSMALFIRQLRADPAMMQHYLDLEPEEAVYKGRVGGPPQFVGVGGVDAAPKSVHRHLTILDEDHEDEDEDEDDEVA
jgi:hypothetical protein